MNLALAQEIVKLILAIFGSMGMVATPIVVAIINNRNKKEAKASPDTPKSEKEVAATPMGQPVDLEQQKFNKILVDQLENSLEIKNALEAKVRSLEDKVRDLEYDKRRLQEKLDEKS